MDVVLTQSLGWIATGVFVSSYFYKRPALLRAMQMCGAALWIFYGFLIHATPVIAANALVFAAAAWTTLVHRRECASRYGMLAAGGRQR
jgi:hypothetical protein